MVTSGLSCPPFVAPPVLSFTSPDGQRIRISSGTSDWEAAREFRDREQAKAWRSRQLGERPAVLWQQAVIRRVQEQEGRKRSLENDRMHLRWAAKHLDGLHLTDINSETIQNLAQARKASGVTNATVNRMLEVIRALLMRAQREWNWLDRVPTVRRLPEPKRRVRWLTHEEATRLLQILDGNPRSEHLAEMVRFTLATGLREQNVVNLRWEQIDLGRRTAWIHQDQLKGAVRSLAVPLDDDAVDVLPRQVGRHKNFVFVYPRKVKGMQQPIMEPVLRANNHAWRRVLKRAGITDFRWHDLRHTWASWLVQAGTPLHVVQELGGWSHHEMVMRYAHLGGQHLQEHANRISGWHKSGTNEKGLQKRSVSP